nr:hypothetical protein [Anaerolineae bacterium]
MAKRSRVQTNRKPVPRQKAAEPVNLAEEYRYVTEDLKRIGIIAAILIGGLLVLAFIL